jgi:hypothetical protein
MSKVALGTGNHSSEDSAKIGEENHHERPPFLKVAPLRLPNRFITHGWRHAIITLGYPSELRAVITRADFLILDTGESARGSALATGVAALTTIQR